MRRQQRIRETLRRGGAINKIGTAYSAHHPSGTFSVTEEEVAGLLNEGALVVVNCGCTGFWWAMRPDLIAAYSPKTPAKNEKRQAK